MPKRKLLTLVFTGVSLILLPILFFTLFKPNTAEATWFDDTFAYRKKITFTHNAALTDRRISITVDTAALTTDKMQADCDDTRFTDQNGQLLRYQLVSGCDTTTTVYDVVFPTVLAASNVGYIYYGNPSVGTASQDVSNFTSLSPSGADTTLGSEEKTQGPISYWGFDEGYGTSTNDTSANNNDGTFGASTAAPSWQTEDQCISSKCLFFDGTNDVVTVANTINGVQTVSFWAKVQSTSSTQELIDLNGTDYLTSVSGTVTANGFGTETVYVDGQVGATLTANRWHYVTVTTSSSLSASAIKIGQVSTNYGQLFMDEVKIYNYARTAAQVKQDFLKGASDKGSSAVLGSSSQSYLSNGLVGYWKMDESAANGCTGGSNDSCDSSGNGNDGAWNGDATTTAGKFGNGITLDGTGDYVNIPDPSSGTLDFGTGNFTVSTWAKTSDTTNQSRLLTKGGGGTPLYQLTKTAAGLVNFQVRDGSSNSATATGVTNIADGTWHHILGTRIGTTTNIYIDGKLDATGTNTSLGSADNAVALTIGQFGDGTLYFAGQLDEVRVYNRDLSPAEARGLYNFAPGPVGYWNMNEKTGTTSINDSSGNSNTGTLSNFTNTDWVQGKYGSALKFNGTTSTINAGSASIVDNMPQISISAWIYPKTVGENSAGKIIDKSDGSTPPASGWTWRLNSANRLIFSVDYDGLTNTEYISTETITLNTWQHVMITWDGSTTSSNIKIYINGIPTTKQGSSTDGAGNHVTDASQSIIIGNNPSGSRTFDGFIDDLKIYNYVRTTGQVIEDLNGGHPLGGSPVGSQVAYWALDEQNGTTPNSTSTEGYTSSITGATWRTKENCKINGCLDFDGSDDVLTITNENAIDFDTNLFSGVTFSAWIYPDTAGEGAGGQILFKQTSTWLRVENLSGGKLDVRGKLDLDTDANVVVTGAVTAGAWNHVALSYKDDTDDEITVWVNGKAVGTSTDGVGSPNTDSSNLLIGGTTTNNFDGKIDEFKIYSTELSQDQILADMNGGSVLNFSTGTNEAAQLTDGAGNPPVGQWNFDEKTGSSANDTSGNNNTGTWNGTLGLQWTQGKYGVAGNFNGTDNGVQMGVPTSFVYDQSTPFTLGTWFLMTGDQNFSNSTVQLISKRNTGQYSISINSSNILVANVIGNTGSANVTGTTTLTNNVWYFTSLVYDGAGTTKLYLNGKLEGSATGSPAGMNLSSGYLGFGYEDASDSRHFKGKMDDIKIYDYVRTQSQVAYDYNRGLPIAHWQLDECQGTTANDVSGFGNNGTITPGASGNTAAGDCTSGTSTHMWSNGATGKINASLDFDGTNDYVDMDDPATLDVADGQDFSITGWFNRDTFTTDDTIVAKSNGQSSVDTGYIAFIDDDSDKLFFQTSDGTSNFQIISSLTFTSTGWNHFAIIWDENSTTNTTIYINGVPSRTSEGVNINTIGNLTNSLDFRIGSEADGGEAFDGKIDDLRVYNYALSASQVRKVMNDNSGVKFGPTTGQP
jgi:hypothetical protein